MSYIVRTGNLAAAPELRQGERGPYTYARVTRQIVPKWPSPNTN